MNFKDKLILVFYIGVEGICDSDVPAYMSEVADYITRGKDESAEFYFIPDPESRTTRVECINPQFLTEERVKEMEEKSNELMKRLSQAVDKMIENGSKPENENNIINQ